MSREIQWYNQQVATLSGPDADVAYLHLVVVDRREHVGALLRRVSRDFQAVDWTLYYESESYPNSGTFGAEGLLNLEKDVFVFLGETYSVNWLTGERREAVARKLEL